jgi:molybdenum cofactor guanylyltransferase
MPGVSWGPWLGSGTGFNGPSLRLAVWTPIPAAAGRVQKLQAQGEAVPTDSCIGILLAGGRARRMGGGDKPLQKLSGIPLLAHAAAALRPQCRSLVLSGNGDPERYSSFDFPFVADNMPGFQGPLAGVLTCLNWIAARYPEMDFALSAPADTPFLPGDLFARLESARKCGASIACASSGGRLHPAVALWPMGLRGELRRAVVDDNMRKVETFVRNYGPTVVDWPNEPYDPFFNVNEPKDLQTAEAILLNHKMAIAQSQGFCDRK